MSTSQKVLMGVALVTLAIAIFMYFKNDHPKEIRIPHPKPEPPHQPLPLKPESDKVLVLFFAPWCGHCKTVMPVWDEIIQNFDGYNGVKIIKVDGDANQDLAKLHAVPGFPTIKLCVKGLKNVEGPVYQGDRSMDSIVQFLQHNA